MFRVSHPLDQLRQSHVMVLHMVRHLGSDEDNIGNEFAVIDVFIVVRMVDILVLVAVHHGDLYFGEALRQAL